MLTAEALAAHDASPYAANDDEEAALRALLDQVTPARKMWP